VLDVQAPTLSFSGKVSPPSIEIKGASRAVHTVTYSIDIQGGQATNIPQETFRSHSGMFKWGRRVLGNQKGTVLVTVLNGHGSAMETLSLPDAVLDQASSEGGNRITYERVFTPDASSSTVKIELPIALVQQRGVSSPSKRSIQGKALFQPRPAEQRLIWTDGNREETSLRTPSSTKKPRFRGSTPASTAAEHTPGRVLVTLDTTRAAGISRRLQDTYDLRLVASHTMTAIQIRVLVFETGPHMAEILKALTGEPGILGAQPDYVYRTQSEPYADLQAIGRTLFFPALHREYRGKGVRVAVLDTGVDIGHRDLEDRVVRIQNLVEGSPLRPEVHGTAVAGLIASGINGFGMEGIAPEAELLAFRCLEQTGDATSMGKGTTLSISRALDLALIEKAQIINLSFGSRAQDPLVTHLLEEGGKRNVLFTAPIGNRSELRSPLFPASHPLVVGVGGLDPAGRSLPSAALAAHARLLAPSVRLFTTLPENRHGFLNGTSFASAVVAGLLALGLEKRKGLTPEDLPPWTGDLRRWTESFLKISLDKNRCIDCPDSMHERSFPARTRESMAP
jgi:hypothetical protein